LLIIKSWLYRTPERVSGTAQIQASVLRQSAPTAFARVTVGTIGSIVNRVHLFRDVVAILVDEVHMVPPAKSSQYRRLFEKLPNTRVHGLTGTPFRADGTGDLAKTFGSIVYRYTFLDALRDGYVKPLVPVDAGEDETIEIEGLKTVAGDFDLEEMAPRAIKLHRATPDDSRGYAKVRT